MCSSFLEEFEPFKGDVPGDVPYISKVLCVLLISFFLLGFNFDCMVSIVTRGKVNAFELRGFENPVSANQSEQKAFVFELSNDLLIGQSAVRLSSPNHSLSFEPH